MFLVLPVRRCARFTLRLKPKVGKDMRDMLKPIATRRQPEKEIKIHCVLKRFVKIVPFFKYPAPNECGGSWNVENAMIKEDEGTEFDLPSDLNRRAILFYRQVVSIDDVDLGIVFKRLDYPLKAARPIAIVRVQPANDISRCSLKPLIHRL